LASSDGENVDSHFGRASKFYHLPDLMVKMWRLFMKTREKTSMDEDIRRCERLWRDNSSPAGLRAKFALEEAGLKFVADEGPIEDVIRRYIRHYKFMKH